VKFLQVKPRLRASGCFSLSFSLVLAIVIAFPALAAPPTTLPGAVQPGHDRPLPQPAQPPAFDFSVEAPQRSAVPRAVDEIHFQLKDIRIVGAVSLSADRFRPLYAGLLGKSVTLADILDVADAIEKEYRAAGFVLVRAYVPPQHVKDGIFTIRIAEGFVAATSVEGGSAETRARVKSYLRPVLADKPLHLGTIERALLIANDIPGVQATGILRPSSTVPGASDLVVTINSPKISGGLSASNRGSHLSGLWTVTGNAAYNDILGNDQLTANATVDPIHARQYGGQLKYAMALGDDGLVGSIFGAASHGAPAGSLGAVDIRTDSWAVGPRLTYPLIRTRDETLSLDGGFTVQDAHVNILGTKISHDQWRVADLAITYLRNDFLAGSWAATIDAAQGLPILGATDNHSPDLSLGGRTTFTKLTGLVHYTAPLFDDFSFAATAQGQYSFNPLIEGEQILFGGMNIGRGYEPGAITGDRGVGGSAELRYDTRIFNDYYIQDLQPYVYLEGARAWNIPRPAEAGLLKQSIASVGAGLRFFLPKNVYADAEVARTLSPVPGSDHDRRETKLLVDVGITF
jgi:hemolysin activation/secretion protein